MTSAKIKPETAESSKFAEQRINMKLLKSFLMQLGFILSLPQLSFSMNQDSPPRASNVFTEGVVGFLCHQLEEDAATKTLNQLQSQADQRCSPQKAKRVSDVDFKWGFCHLNVKASFVCGGEKFCKPYKYTIMCCDDHGCWKEFER